ncbi:putative ribosomal protein L22, bacterial/chloroplast-type [Helianthus annuus]|nr:putative ribosomal protein L22, bacterial/chloroplast-type [Helianthus annuus]
MVGWHRHVQSILLHVGKRAENICYTHANFSTSPLKFSPLQDSSYYLSCLLSHLHGLCVPPAVSRPLYHYFQQLGFTSTRRLLSSDATAGASPLTPTLANRYGQAEAEKAVSKPSKVQAILKNIKQVLHYAINSVIYRLSVPM